MGYFSQLAAGAFEEEPLWIRQQDETKLSVDGTMEYIEPDQPSEEEPADPNNSETPTASDSAGEMTGANSAAEQYEVVFQNRSSGTIDRAWFVHHGGNWWRVYWLDDGCMPEPEDLGNPDLADCLAWIYPEDNMIFLPMDGQCGIERCQLEDGLPDPDAHWYEVTTGQQAILGLADGPVIIY